MGGTSRTCVGRAAVAGLPPAGCCNGCLALPRSGRRRQDTRDFLHFSFVPQKCCGSLRLRGKPVAETETRNDVLLFGIEGVARHASRRPHGARVKRGMLCSHEALFTTASSRCLCRGTHRLCLAKAHRKRVGKHDEAPNPKNIYSSLIVFIVLLFL